MTGTADSCRIDIWLWRARFFKTRALAGAFVSAGRVRVIRAGVEARLDKPSRSVRPGEELIFVIAGRIIALRIRDIGERRGPASEAAQLFEPIAPQNE